MMPNLFLCCLLLLAPKKGLISSAQTNIPKSSQKSTWFVLQSVWRYVALKGKIGFYLV
jgi:hypothetical protein